MTYPAAQDDGDRIVDAQDGHVDGYGNGEHIDGIGDVFGGGVVMAMVLIMVMMVMIMVLMK